MLTWRTVAPALAAYTLVGYAVRVDAQVRTVAPGDASVSGRHIEPYTNEWRMTYRAADGAVRPVGRWLDSLDVVTIDGVEYLRHGGATIWEML